MKSFKPFERTAGRLELDLRKELNKFMFGASDEIAKGGLFILRKMDTRDGIVYANSEDDLIPCLCKIPTEHEPEIDYRCDKCDGEGYLFKDIIVPGYKTNRFEYQDIEKYKSWGKHTISMSFFYIEYFDAVNRYDKVIEPVIDLEGKVVTPVEVLHSHNIHMAERYRGDYGRTEYWRLSCFGE